jgi:Peptidase family M23
VKPLEERTLLRGAPLPPWTVMTEASLDLGLDEAGQLGITIVDDGLLLLASGAVAKRATVDLDDLRMEIAAVETRGGGAGTGELRVTCRPAAVRRLKDRRGPMRMGGASPTAFVLAECAAAGVACVAQESAAQAEVSRDTEGDDSSWSTFDRLAREVGFVVYEAAGVVYFGKPTWLLARAAGSPLVVGWGKNVPDGEAAWELPSCRTSDDDTDDAEVSVKLPLERAQTARPGGCLRLHGIPTFSRDYLISGVQVDLTEPDGTVSAKVPRDPVPQPPAAPGGGAAPGPAPAPAGEGGSNPGGYIWPMRGKITGEFGTPRPGHMHAGIDIAAPTGTPIKAARGGTVAHAGVAGGYGNAVYLDHGGTITRYGHMSRVNVGRGARVGQGDVIGLCGSTGNSTGPHLHFEVRPGNKPINPRKVLP